jgi:hypothetical protein
MKRDKKKLTISRESLKRLSVEEQKLIAGGAGKLSGQQTCYYCPGDPQTWTNGKEMCCCDSVMLCSDVLSYAK